MEQFKTLAANVLLAAVAAASGAYLASDGQFDKALLIALGYAAVRAAVGIIYASVSKQPLR
jgi:hypothetical protein